MTVWDLHCDFCGEAVPSPQGPTHTTRSGVRFVYHPGRASLRDDSGLSCAGCWSEVAPARTDRPAGRCVVCGATVHRYTSLHVRRFDDPATWQLCEPDAAEFLNRLRTVRPKFDPSEFRLPLHDSAGGPAEPDE